MYKYDNEEWENVVARDAEWDRAETDYLLGLCEQFDLRFLVIADRYKAGVPSTVHPLLYVLPHRQSDHTADPI